MCWQSGEREKEEGSKEERRREKWRERGTGKARAREIRGWERGMRGNEKGEEGREGAREGGREGGREGRREGGREGWRKGERELEVRRLVYLFKEIVADAAAANGVVGRKEDLDELAKAGGVLIAHRLGVAKGLQQWIALNDLVLDLPCLEEGVDFLAAALEGGVLGGGGSKKLDDEFCDFSLAGSRLAGAQDGLAYTIVDQTVVGILRHSEHVRCRPVRVVLCVLPHLSVRTPATAWAHCSSR